MAIIANACVLVEQASASVGLRLDSVSRISLRERQLVSTDWPCRMLFEEGGFHCGDLCSLDLLGQDKINPREHSHSDEDAEGEEGVGFEVVHLVWFPFWVGGLDELPVEHFKF